MIPNQRAKFSLPKNSVYLNCAYMSPLMKKVERAGVQGIMRKRNPLQISPTDFFTETNLVRAEFAKLVGTKQPERIVIVPSVSYGLANVAKNIVLKPNQNILVASEQFPSNYYSWQRLCNDAGASLKVISPPDTLTGRGEAWNHAILQGITSATKVVALGNVHWADGTMFNLKQIRKRASEVGALLIVDGTQSVGALPFYINEIKPDALVCASYKWLMGPYSIGLAYYGAAFDRGVPVEENWINRLHSENFAGLVNYEANYQPGALRYEVGEHSNFALMPMLLEALKQINSWKPERIQQYTGSISANAVEQLRQSACWVEDERFRGSHLFGIRVARNRSIDRIKASLQKSKISVSFRGDCIRVSPHLYNSREDFDKLVKAIVQA